MWVHGFRPRLQDTKSNASDASSLRSGCAAEDDNTETEGYMKIQFILTTLIALGLLAFSLKARGEQTLCPTCHGVGNHETKSGEVVKCTQCNGTGKYTPPAPAPEPAPSYSPPANSQGSQDCFISSHLVPISGSAMAVVIGLAALLFLPRQKSRHR
jgi:hypothetical protein